MMGGPSPLQGTPLHVELLTFPNGVRIILSLDRSAIKRELVVLPAQELGVRGRARICEVLNLQPAFMCSPELKFFKKVPNTVSSRMSPGRLALITIWGGEVTWTCSVRIDVDSSRA